MDYGVRLFRHVLAQVFGNLGEAGRISAIPAVILAALGYWAFADGLSMINTIEYFDPNASTLPPGFDEDVAMRAVGRGFLVAIISVLLFSWVAVAWHRYVLTEEAGGFFPIFSMGRVMGYVGRSFLIALLIILVLFPIMMVVGGLLTTPIGFAISIGANFLASWIFVRWALILPAWSVDRRMKIGESWAATKDVSGEILVPIIGFAVIFTILQEIIGMLPPGAVQLILFCGAFWIQTLINLALLTTLYGNLVENRELN